MTCEDIQHGAVIERYLRNELDARETEAFERHYFECGPCFETLEATRAARQALVDSGPPAAAAPRRGGWMRPLYGIGAAAAIAAMVMFVWTVRRPEKPGATAPVHPASQVVASLPPLQAPPFEQQRFRDAGAHRNLPFEVAMQSYSGHDYRAAAEALGRLLEQHPESLEARHFLGLSLLLEGNAAASVPHLRAVADAGDRSPYSEEGRYYLAQALLRTGDAAGASRELEAVVAAHGDYEERAKADMASFR